MDVVLCSAPPDGCRDTTSYLENNIRDIFSGIKWLGGRVLHTTRSTAQIFVGVVLNLSSHVSSV